MENIKFKKKSKITSLSFINNLFNTLLENHEIDFFRFDSAEICELFGYKDKKILSSENIVFITKSYTGKIPLYVDVPVSLIYSENIYEIINFYNETRAYGLSFDIKYSSFDFMRKLKFENIPFIGFSSNNDNNYETVKDCVLEIQSIGSDAVILENYTANFIESLKLTVNIPILSDVSCKNDGSYRKTTDIIGLSDKFENKMLNFDELFKESIKDYCYQSSTK